MLSNKTMKLLGDGPVLDKDQNGDNVPELEQVHSVLVHCNVVQNSKLLYTFAPDKSFGQLLVLEPKALIQSKTTDSVFDYIEIWITDQNNRALQIEDSANITLIIETRA